MKLKILLFILIILLFSYSSCKKRSIEEKYDIYKSSNIEFLNAVIRSDYNKVKELIGIGVDIDTKDDNGNTPLMIAIDNEDIDMTILLINNNTNLNTQNNDKKTALGLAKEKGNEKILNIIIQTIINSEEKIEIVKIQDTTDDTYFSILELIEGKGKTKILKLSEIIKLLKENTQK